MFIYYFDQHNNVNICFTCMAWKEFNLEQSYPYFFPQFKFIYNSFITNTHIFYIKFNMLQYVIKK